ncbi:uncharacterized protein V6R79_023625 [Siganus canaliculatus]
MEGETTASTVEIYYKAFRRIEEWKCSMDESAASTVQREHQVDRSENCESPSEMRGARLPACGRGSQSISPDGRDGTIPTVLHGSATFSPGRIIEETVRLAPESPFNDVCDPIDPQRHVHTDPSVRRAQGGHGLSGCHVASESSRAGEQRGAAQDPSYTMFRKHRLSRQLHEQVTSDNCALCFGTLTQHVCSQDDDFS